MRRSFHAASFHRSDRELFYSTTVLSAVMSTNIEDDDAPPELVDVSAIPPDQHGSLEEEQTPRVPITLVTGMKVPEGNRP